MKELVAVLAEIEREMQAAKSTLPRRGEFVAGVEVVECVEMVAENLRVLEGLVAKAKALASEGPR